MKRSGFTVLELVFVIAIIGVLGTIGYKGFQSVATSANAQKLIDQLKQIEIGLAEYYKDTGSYPLDLGLLVGVDGSLQAAGYDSKPTCFDARKAAIGKQGDPYVMKRYGTSGYVDGMEATENGCIKAKVGAEICFGALGDKDSIDSFDMTQNVFTKGGRTNCAPGLSVGNKGDSAYHLLTVKGVELDLMQAVFQKLTGTTVDTHIANLTEYKDIYGKPVTKADGSNLPQIWHGAKYTEKIGVPSSDNAIEQKAFVYRWRGIF